MQYYYKCDRYDFHCSTLNEVFWKISDRQDNKQPRRNYSTKELARSGIILLFSFVTDKWFFVNQEKSLFVVLILYQTTFFKTRRHFDGFGFNYIGD